MNESAQWNVDGINIRDRTWDLFRISPLYRFLNTSSKPELMQPSPNKGSPMPSLKEIRTTLASYSLSLKTHFESHFHVLTDSSISVTTNIKLISLAPPAFQAAHFRSPGSGSGSGVGTGTDGGVGSSSTGGGSNGDFSIGVRVVIIEHHRNDSEYAIRESLDALLCSGRGVEGEQFFKFSLLLMQCRSEQSGEFSLSFRQWLHFRFDCYTFPLTLQPHQLYSLLPTLLNPVGLNKQSPGKQKNIRLTLSIPVQDLSKFILTIPYHHLKVAIDRLRDSKSGEYPATTLFSVLEKRVFHHFGVPLAFMVLISIGTPVAYVSTHGKLKAYCSENFLTILQHIAQLDECEFGISRR